jgi:hypothetical protein
MVRRSRTTRNSVVGQFEKFVKNSVLTTKATCDWNRSSIFQGSFSLSFRSFGAFAPDGFPCLLCGFTSVALGIAFYFCLSASSNLFQFWDQLQRLTIECGNQPVDYNLFRGNLESSDFLCADASATTFQLNETKIEDIGILRADAENNRVNDSRSWRTGSAFKKGNAPFVRFAIRTQCLFAGSFGSAGFGKCVQALFGLDSLFGSRASFACTGRFLAWGEIG